MKTAGKASTQSNETPIMGGDFSSPVFLLEQLRNQQEENRKLLARIDILQDQLALLLRLIHGSKSEKRPVSETLNGEQSLFADSELSAELLVHKQEPLLKGKPPEKRVRRRGE
jgi:hypothetical protein